MSDEEKKAIEKFKNIIYTYQDVIEDEYSDYEEKESAKEYQEVSETILNLIEKQFKEIEILSKNMNLLREQNISYKQSIHRLKEMNKIINKNWEDKIKSKIEELDEKLFEKNKILDNLEIYYKKEVLKSLLKEE